MTDEQFAQACVLMPPEVEWGDALTPARVLHIRAQARAELIAEMEEKPAGYLIDWPDEPDLGHYYAEDPTDTGRCQPLAIIPKEPTK